MRQLEEWDEEYLLEVANQQSETEYFEKKGSDLLQQSKGNYTAEIAKGVCAFANSGDGFFAIGIVKTGGLDAGVSEMYGKQTIKEWAEQVIPTLLQPPINSCQARFIRHSQYHAADRGVLIIFVPISHSRPHWTTESGTREIAFIRAGEHSRPMRMQTLLDISSRAESRFPHLQISLNAGPPDCQLTQVVLKKATESDFRGEIRTEDAVYGSAYYFRLRIENQSSETARDTEVFVSDLLRRQGDEFIPVPEFLPQNLRWSHSGNLFCKQITPGIPKLCDVGRIIDPARRSFLGPSENPADLSQNFSGFSLCVEGQMFLGRHVLIPGEYKAVISVAAANGQEPARRNLKLAFNGQWSSFPETMLKNHVQISIE